MSNIEHKQLEIEGRRIEEGANHFVEAMNELVAKGFDLDEVFMAGLYAFGNAMASRGVVLNVNGILKEQLPPFYDGYQLAKRRRYEAKQAAKPATLN